MSPRRIAVLTVAVGACLSLGVGLGVVVKPTGTPASGSRGTVESWVTDLTTDQRLTREPGTRWRVGPGRPESTIVVDPTRRYQAMTGFGASMTDSAAYVLSTKLRPRVRRAIMRELFSPVDGIGLSVLRQPMGASDFAVGRAYSYDDQPAGKTDPDLSEFSIRHDRAYILPRLRQARALNTRLTFMASPWSAPGWMKDTDSMITGSLLPRYHQAYADYFAKFVKAYRRAGIPTHYVTMQNEPLYEPADYPGMEVLPDQAGAFIAGHLGPTLAREGLDVKILGYDHNWEITDYPEALYADPRVAGQLAGTAWHCYAGEVVAQSVSHNNYPHAQAFHSECSGGDWQGSEQTAFELTMASVIGGPRNWGQSVVLWNLALDENNGPFIGGCTSCRGVVTVHDDGTVTKEPDYWALGHASRFVKPGAVRIGSSVHPSAARADTAERGLTNAAFTNSDGSQVLVAHNATSRRLEFDVQLGDGHFVAALAPGAAATYRWRAPTGVLPVDNLGWVDLDYGPGPSGTPGGRLVASVGPEVVGALAQVKLGEQWLAYSLPYGAELVRPGPATALSRTGWSVTAEGTVTVPEHPLANMLDGDRATRWSSGVGQREGISLTVDLGAERTFSEIVLDAASSRADFLRRYTVQTSPDGVTWTDIAGGPGRPSLTGEMVIALPTTTTRYLRLVAGTSSLSWWSVHELNLRNSAAVDDPVPPNESLVVSTGVLPDGTTVTGHYNPGPDSAAVPFPVRGFGYGYRLPPTAAVTYAVLETSPAAGSDRDDLPPGERGGPTPTPRR